MIPNPQEQELVTPEQRRDAAKPYLGELSKLAPKPVTLFGIEQHVMDLLDARQDVLERIEKIKTPGGFCSETEMDFLCDAEAELAICDSELAKLAGLEENKVDHCANVLRMCDRMIQHRKDERDRQNRMAKRWESIKEGVEKIVMEALTLTERTRFDSPTNTLRMQRNSTPRVEIVNAQAVQDRFISVLVQFPLDRWKQVLKALPDLLPEYYSLKEQTFNTAAIAKVMKAAASADIAARGMPNAGERLEAAKKIERVKGAELKYGRHLRCE